MSPGISVIACENLKNLSRFRWTRKRGKPLAFYKFATFYRNCFAQFRWGKHDTRTFTYDFVRGNKVYNNL